MDLEFTEEANSDLIYIRNFLIEGGVPNYQEIIGNLILATDKLLVFPKLGIKVEQANDPELVRD